MSKGFHDSIINQQSGESLVPITDNLATHAEARAIYFGAALTVDVYTGNSEGNIKSNGVFQRDWIIGVTVAQYQILPQYCKGIRINGSGAAPSAGQVWFVY